MLKNSYLIYAANNNRYLHTGWLLSVLGILPENTDPSLDYDVKLRTVNRVLEVLVDEKWEVIEDFYYSEPLYPRNDIFTVYINDIKCIRETMETTYGIFIANLITIEYPYKGIVSYHNGRLAGGVLNKIGLEAIHRKDVSVRENHIPFEDSISALTVLGSVVVPTATRRSSVGNPIIEQKKPKILKRYEGKLDDPASVTKLQDELMQLDIDYIDGDPFENFLISDKTKMGRLRTVGWIGPENDFIDESKIYVLTQSLSEGIRLEDIPVVANRIRGGSYSRGVATAFTGADVKVAARLFQNYKIAEEDCGTIVGSKVLIHIENYKDFVGRYQLGTSTPLTEDDLKNKVNSSIIMRVPGRCISVKTGLCKMCMGTVVGNTRVKLPAQMTNITQIMMGIYMALMHATKMSTKAYNYKLRIT